MHNLFSVGEVSKYQNISKQTLLFYDKIGLFCPVYVNPENGYRYYSASQLDSLDTILLLKKVGFSLKEIREMMKHYTTERSLAVLRQQLSAIDRQIAELCLIRNRLQNRCDQMERAKAHLEKAPSVTMERVKPQYILCHDVPPPYTLAETSIATKQCFAQAFQEKLPIFFQCGVIVPFAHLQAGQFTAATVAFLLTDHVEGVPNVRQIPGGLCVSTYQLGEYTAIESSYQRLLSYCRENELEILSDSYELCINDYITSLDETEYITKIMLFVKE